jgi:L-ascorbate 6-phosphate lactonase
MSESAGPRLPLLSDPELPGITVRWLGQSGVVVRSRETTVVIDPYLTDSVGKEFGPALHRLVPVPVLPRALVPVTAVVVTHEHLDHFDPDTLAPMAAANPSCAFYCPRWLCERLSAVVGREAHALGEAEWHSVGPSFAIRAIPAAHPTVERDPAGALVRMGVAIEAGGQLLVHVGDTSPNEDAVRAVRAIGTPALAMLPVNERNHYRERAGILGNMSLQEAFQFAAELRARILAPIHWDMFGPNSVHESEIALHAELYPAPFSVCALQRFSAQDVPA